VAQLPDCLISFSIKNYKGIKHAECEGLEDANWVFLTGENGSGKTTALQILTSCLSFKHQGFLDGKKHSKNNFRVVFRDNNIVKETLIIDNESIDKTSPKANYYYYWLKNLAVYGPTRLNIQAEETKNEISRKSQTGYGLFFPDAVYHNIEYDLHIWKLEKNKKFGIVKSIFKTIIPILKDIILEGRTIKYIEKDASGKTYVPVKFEQLPSGYQSIIALVGDMYIRLSKNQPNTPAAEMAGVVIIDELDMHLHPSMQMKLPALLSKAFPKVQFIASTHSPIPLLGAPENSVFIKVERTEEKGITCERLDIKVEDLTVNTILSSPLFGISVISPNKKGNLEEVHTEDTYEELLKNEATKKKLKELYKSGKTFSDELFE